MGPRPTPCPWPCPGPRLRRRFARIAAWRSRPDACGLGYRGAAPHTPPGAVPRTPLPTRRWFATLLSGRGRVSIYSQPFGGLHAGFIHPAGICAQPAGRPHASADARRVHRPAPHRRPGPAAAPRHRGRPHDLLDLLRPSRLRQDDPRLDHREHDAFRVRAAQRRHQRRRRRAQGHQGSAGPPLALRAGDVPAAGRVPPLEQVPERQHPPSHRAGRRALHRLHDGKPARLDDPGHRQPVPDLPV